MEGIGHPVKRADSEARRHNGRSDGMKERVAEFLGKALLVLGWCGIPVLAAAVGGDDTGLLKTLQPLPISPEPPAEASAPAFAPGSKIRFDLDRLNADGLQGPPDGLRTLHYEYCIPDRAEAIREVASIDPTLEIHRGAPGRVGCGPGELLCLGHTHQPNHREILQRLAVLPIITEIRECFFE